MLVQDGLHTSCSYPASRNYSSKSAISCAGEGEVEAGFLLQRIGSEAGHATVGVAFADEGAANQLEGDGLQETWKIEARDQQIKMRSGLPVKLGQGDQPFAMVFRIEAAALGICTQNKLYQEL